MLGAVELLEARSTKPAPPSQVRSSVPPALDRAVLWLLDPDPRARPNSARVWLAELAEQRDHAVLGAAVQRVGGPAIPSAQTEAAPKKPDAPPTIDDTVLLPQRQPEPKRPRSKIWIAPLLFAIGGAIGIALASRPKTNSPPPPPPPTEVLPPRVVQRIQTETIAAEMPDASVPKKRVRPPKQQPRIAITGAVQVDGGGMSGPAPKTSAPLKEGPTLLQLASGELRILLRVEKKRDAVRVTIGAPPGNYYDVECTGHPRASTPLIGIQVSGAMRCSVVRGDGVRAMFGIERVML